MKSRSGLMVVAFLVFTGCGAALGSTVTADYCIGDRAGCVPTVEATEPTGWPRNGLGERVQITPAMWREAQALSRYTDRQEVAAWAYHEMRRAERDQDDAHGIAASVANSLYETVPNYAATMHILDLPDTGGFVGWWAVVAALVGVGVVLGVYVKRTR